MKKGLFIFLFIFSFINAFSQSIIKNTIKEKLKNYTFYEDEETESVKQYVLYDFSLNKNRKIILAFIFSPANASPIRVNL